MTNITDIPATVTDSINELTKSLDIVSTALINTYDTIDEDKVVLNIQRVKYKYSTSKQELY